MTDDVQSTGQSSKLTREAIERAIAMIRDNSTWQPTPTEPMHPAVYEAAVELAGLPPGSPLTRADLARAQLELYNRADDEGKRMLLAAAFGVFPEKDD